MSMEDNHFEADMDGIDRMFSKVGIWTTREGVEIKISDMGDKHLCNTLRFLERQAPKAIERMIDLAERVGATMNGEMAQYAIESDIRQMQSGEMDTDDVFPVYAELMAEANKRGLSW